jgi:hypothetical protein
MLIDRVKVQLPTGELKEVDCPDVRAVEVNQPLPVGSYVAATCGHAATNTVLNKDGQAIGWVAADDYMVGQY